MASRSSGALMFAAYVDTWIDARPSVCTAISQIGSDVMRLSASGASAGQSMTGLVGVVGSEQHLAEHFLMLCGPDLDLADGPIGPVAHGVVGLGGRERVGHDVTGELIALCGFWHNARAFAAMTRSADRAIKRPIATTWPSVRNLLERQVPRLW